MNLVNHEYLNHQVEVSHGVMADECSALISAFFKRRRAEKKTAKKAQKILNQATINNPETHKKSI